MATTATVTLWERSEALRIVEDWILEHEEEIAAGEGVLPPEIEAALDEAMGDFKEKAERVGLYVRELLNTAELIRDEEDRLAARRKARERAATGLKEYLKRNMEAAGITKVDGLLCTVAVQKSPRSLRCSVAPEQIIERYPDTWSYFVAGKVTYSFKARELLANDPTGADLPPEFTVEQGTHVRIR